MSAEHDYHDPPPPDPLDEAYAAGWQAGAEAQRASDVALAARFNFYDAARLEDVPLVTLPKGEG